MSGGVPPPPPLHTPKFTPLITLIIVQYLSMPIGLLFLSIIQLLSTSYFIVPSPILLLSPGNCSVFLWLYCSTVQQNKFNILLYFIPHYHSVYKSNKRDYGSVLAHFKDNGKSGTFPFVLKNTANTRQNLSGRSRPFHADKYVYIQVEQYLLLASYFLYNIKSLLTITQRAKRCSNF